MLQTNVNIKKKFLFLIPTIFIYLFRYDYKFLSELIEYGFEDSVRRRAVKDFFF
jgi:hypothetical protein